jgi:hypothetical protein
LVVNRVVGEKCKKFIQFATLFNCPHLIAWPKSIIEYEAHKELFDFFNVEENSKLH